MGHIVVKISKKEVEVYSSASLVYEIIGFGNWCKVGKYKEG